MVKNFPLRINDEKTYLQLKKISMANYTSVNTLINIALKEYLKIDKKDFVISK